MNEASEAQDAQIFDPFRGVPWKSDGAAELILNGFYDDFVVINGMPERRLLQMLPGDAIPQVIKWVGGMADPVKKKTAYEILAHHWMHSDQEAATAWLKTSPLSKGDRDRILRHAWEE